jgi:hypothetical protein
MDGRTTTCSGKGFWPLHDHADSWTTLEKHTALLSSIHILYVCIGNVEEPEIRGRIPPKYA